MFLPHRQIGRRYRSVFCAGTGNNNDRRRLQFADGFKQIYGSTDVALDCLQRLLERYGWVALRSHVKNAVWLEAGNDMRQAARIADVAALEHIARPGTLWFTQANSEDVAAS